MKNETIIQLPAIMIKNKMRIKWNSKISGIYAWFNEINGKMYIGQSTNLYKRVYDEMNGFRNQKHQNLLKLFNAIQKYGTDNFRVVKLLECPKEYLHKLETLLINYYDTKRNGYNCTDGGEGSVGHAVTKNQVKKQKEKMSKYWTEDRKKEHSEKMKLWFINKTDIEKQYIKQAGQNWIKNVDIVKKHKENTIKSLTIERIEKQRKSIKKYYKNNVSKKRIIKQIISPSNEIIEINGLDYFCKIYHIKRLGIVNVLNGKKKHHKGWHTDPNFIYNPIIKRVVSPDGKIYEFQSTIKFCREHHLCLGGIKNVLNKKHKHHKLWRLPEISLEEAANNKNFVYKNIQFQFPDNHTEKVFERDEFCKRYNFSSKYLYKFLKKKKIGDTFYNLKLISK